MKKIITLSLAVVIPSLVLNPAVRAAEPKAADVRTAIQQAAYVHLAHPSGVDICHWVIAPFYDGLLRAGFTTGDASLVNAVLGFGQQAGWMPGYRPYHADDQAVGHAWLDLYLLDQTRKERLEPMKKVIDHVLANPVTVAVDHANPKAFPGAGPDDRWTWCDSLYMAPPTWARMAAATGDSRYLDFLDREFRVTYDRLFDHEAGFFYRDGRYVGKKTAAGHRTFWSRGNGWVYGGLALLLESLPTNHPTRGFYEQLFREMTVAVLRTQQASGLWNPNLDDPEEIPMGEASGSGFFVFGLAWGINHGLLDRAAHWPAIERGWKALLGCRRPDGMIGRVQPIGASPDKFGPESIQDYGTGAFLLAGSELLRLLGGATQESPAAILARAQIAHDAAVPTVRAYARLVPERADDLAWENDKVAFRVYGPALREGTEDSGMDAWTKRVAYPVVDSWYRKDLTEHITYHKDNGEGLDGFHVGNSRGCGGLGLWIDGKLVTADTYVVGQINWTSPNEAQFTTFYRYPVKIRNRPLYEVRVTRLRLGERLSSVEVFFTDTLSRQPKRLENFDPEIAIGLVTQGKAAEMILDASPRLIAVYEPFAGGTLGTGMILDSGDALRTATLPAEDPKGLNRQALVFTRLGADKTLRYRTGFAWSGDGEITSKDAWLRYLQSKF